MAEPKVVTYLKDYQPSPYLIDNTQLKFVLNEDKTCVLSKLFIRKNPTVKENHPSLVLSGEHLTLKHVAIDGVALADNAYELDEHQLTIKNVPEQFILTIETEIKPHENTSLSGLYTSKGMYCTQCESHGFRRMTYYLDRPDVMSTFTTIIEADKSRYPVLLSNGNRVAEGELAHNRHWVEWRDPHKKPAYLFALVAGDLLCISDTFTTQSGRIVDLHIYVENGNEDKVQHAMESLKQAMHWDEKAYGREYDLDIYMIVAVNDFNMGAMENKGLNIFNAKYILANPQTATDQDYQHITHVVGHEYFHNWSGNRVTLRDWFQLSLKEGFTVFREQQFAASLGSSSVQRIEEAKLLRHYQFPEDAGPMAHPVRPASYIEINNFYTMTVYEKGAEVIRMLSTLLGNELFRKGCDLYFTRYDGQAVTTDDFVACMQGVAQIDLTQFELWYSQAGTPELTATWQYDASKQRFILYIKQHTPPTPSQKEKQPLHIPFKVALVFDDKVSHETVLEIKSNEQQFVFENITKEPIPSLLRGFSAPVKLKANYTEDALIFIVKHDNDPICRYDALVELYYRAMKAEKFSESTLDLIRDILTHCHEDPQLTAYMLHLPTESALMDMADEIDIESIHTRRELLCHTLSEFLRNEFTDCYEKLLQTGPYDLSHESIAKRTLKNVCLQYLSRSDATFALQQFSVANNMTDSLAALQALSNSTHAEREYALNSFYQKWQHDPLVLDKWFSIQALSHFPQVLDNVESLIKHPQFDIKNPNRVQALLGQFSRHNPYYFHEKNGRAYQLYETLLLQLDQLNPQVASRIAQVFTTFKRFASPQKQLMQKTLEHLSKQKLSADLYEIVNKSLKDI